MDTTNGGTMDTTNEIRETYFARLLEGCAQGLTVQESIAAVCGIDVHAEGARERFAALAPEDAQKLTDACSAANDVAAEYLEQGLDPEDVDASWSRLRAMALGLREGA